MTDLTFDAAAAGAFLTALYQGPHAAEGLIEINFDRRDEEKGHWILDRWERFTPEKIDEAIDCARRATSQDARVYFGAGLRRSDLGRFEKSHNADIVAWPALVWDFDDIESATWGLARAAEIGLDFHLVVQTGAIRMNDQPDLRVQCWALLDTPCFDLELVQRTMKRGISVLGSDKSIHDSRRVMRLPGSIAWARKDGRVDESTRLRPDLSEICARFSIDKLAEILGGAEPKAPAITGPERVAEIRERITSARGARNPRRGSRGASAFINDLMQGIEMNPPIFGLAQAAAREGHDGTTIRAHRGAVLDASVAQATRPDRVNQLRSQLPGLVGRAIVGAGLGSQEAHYTPATVDLPVIPAGRKDGPADNRQALFARYVWVKAMEAPFDTQTHKLLTRLQFNVDRCDVGNPNISAQCAWAVFIAEYPSDHPDSPGRRRVVSRMTYRPGGALIMQEPDGAMAVNTWVASTLVLAPSASDADVEPYLAHVRHVMGEHTSHFLDYMAFLVQHPGVKITLQIVSNAVASKVDQHNI